MITALHICVVGTFGKVYHGTLIGDDENDMTSHKQIFIKTVSGEGCVVYCISLNYSLSQIIPYQIIPCLK